MRGVARLISSARTTLAKTGPGRKRKSPSFWSKKRDAADVGWQEIGGELDAAELAADRAREGAGEGRLAHARHVLDQDVPLAEQGDEQQLDHRPLPTITCSTLSITACASSDTAAKSALASCHPELRDCPPGRVHGEDHLLPHCTNVQG